MPNDLIGTKIPMLCIALAGSSTLCSAQDDTARGIEGAMGWGWRKLKVGIEGKMGATG